MGNDGGKAKKESDGTPLSARIEHMLTEARLVLPGAQALFGFQLVVVLSEAFENLPAASKLLHALSAGCLALAVILLMAPAAYHRIVEGGEDTERFYRFASRMVLLAMLPLAAGIIADFFVVARKVTGSVPFASAGSAVMLVFFYGLWFGFTTWARRAAAVERPAVDAGRPAA